MSAIITKEMSFFGASQFIEAFGEGQDNVYLAIGKQTPWNSEIAPDIPLDNISSYYNDYRDIIAAKKITPQDVSFVIPRVEWTSGTVYSMYDDTDNAIYVKEFYVRTPDNRVWKCISNNNNAVSVSQPTLPIISNVTDVVQTADGYLWKYMFSISNAQFLTNNWIPVSTLLADDGSHQWTIQQSAIDGAIHVIKVINQGSGYIGTPTVQIVGDGIGATATANVVGGFVTSITMTSIGSGYNWATVTISGGGGAGATARAIIPPTGGHGKDAVKELGGNRVMIMMTLNNNESQKFTTSNDYRKIILIRNPMAAGNIPASGSVYDLSTRLTFNSTTAQYQVDETITGQTSGATASVIDYNSSSKTARINHVSGTFAVGETVVGATSTASGAINTITNPEFNLFTGEILFRDYRLAINRSPTQNETIGLVVDF
jgi:hypothetical protein